MAREEPSSKRRRWVPSVVTRTMRGGRVDPRDVPDPDPELDVDFGAGPVRVRRTVAEDGSERISAWLPQSVAEHMIALLEDSARYNREIEDDSQRARQAEQYAADLRAVLRLGGELDLTPPAAGAEREN